MKILARDVIEEEIIHGREHMQEYDSFQFYENKRAMRVRRGGGDRSVNIRERKKNTQIAKAITKLEKIDFIGFLYSMDGN